MAGKEYETVTDSIHLQHQPNAGIMSSAGYHTSIPYPTNVQARGLTSLPPRLDHAIHETYQDSKSRPPRTNNQTFPGVRVTYANDNGPRNSHRPTAAPLKQHNVDIQSDRLPRHGSSTKPSVGSIKQSSLDIPPHYHHNVPRQDSTSRQSAGPTKQSSLDVSSHHNNVPSQDSTAGPSNSGPSSTFSGEVLPNKKNTSVYSVANERYVLDKPSIRDHENEDEFLVHSNNFSVCLSVMDGHDGLNAVKYVREYLWKKVFSTNSWLKVSQVDNPDQIKIALIEFIKVIDADFFRSISAFIHEKVQLQLQIPKVICV